MMAGSHLTVINMNPAASTFRISALAPDIGAYIHEHFPETHAEVVRKIESFISKHDYLAHPRIVRCILYLSKTRNQPIEWAMEVGAGDPRDVMMWAEYVDQGAGERPERVRDFNKPFGENDIT